MQRKFLAGAVVQDSSLSDRQILVIANSGQPDRVSDVLIASGCVRTNYEKNPIVLLGHDPMRPVGNAKLYVVGEQLRALITFAPLGASRCG
jgi:hypothetical protein